MSHKGMCSGRWAVQVLKTRGDFTACIVIVADPVVLPYYVTMVKTPLELLKRLRVVLDAPRRPGPVMCTVTVHGAKHIFTVAGFRSFAVP